MRRSASHAFSTLCRALADDFFEIGRSGRSYTRAQTLAVPAQPIHADLPLAGFRVHQISPTVAHTTYVSVVRYETEERAARSSIWTRADDAHPWKLRFHQGTPLP